MWRLVFIQINDPEDLTNISKCSIFFRELLTKRRVYFLIPKVLNLVVLRTTGKKLELIEEKANIVKLETYLMKSDENLKEEILNCRLVCSVWNKAVQSCYERPFMTCNTKFLSDINLKFGFCKPYPWNMQRFCFYFQLEKASTFLQTFEASHFILEQKNPFLGRLVHFEITLDPVGPEVDFVSAVENILRMFGRHVWYAYLLITSKQDVIGVTKYLKIVEYIRHLPNLRFLYLRLNSFVTRNCTKAFFIEHPLPSLKHLVVLEVCDLDGLMLDELLNKNNHVLYFGMHRQHNFNGNISKTLRTLKGISATCVHESNQQTINWIGTKYDLEILQLQQRCSDFDMSLNFERFTTCLSNSLRDLTLELLFPVDQRQLYEDCKNLRLGLPHLQRLAVQFSGVHAIDFICGLNNLELLEVLLAPKEFTANYEFYQQLIESEQVIEFVGFEKNMKDSNIWEIVKKLKKLKIYFGESTRCYEYTRL